MITDAPVLEAQNVSRRFPAAGGRLVHALTDVSISLGVGETLAVVGESGCGKSTLARAVTYLDPPNSGVVQIAGHDAARLLAHNPMELRRSIQMVFQDPFSSVNPRRRIGNTIADGLRLHHITPPANRRAAVRDLMERVGLIPDLVERFPHELSGGQRQRVAIARALAVGPRVIVCDEPVSALDVSIQAQVMNLLMDIQRDVGIAYLFISHDLALVEHIADRIVVMYLGQIVEMGSVVGMRASRLHPYSRSLFAAAPRIGTSRHSTAPLLEGDVGNPIDLPPGCRFHTRCPIATTRCRAEPPELRDIGGRAVRCHYAEAAMPAQHY